MNIQQIVSELEKKYPGKNIIVDDGVGYSEIIVELEPTKDHSDHSLALAIVGKSKPHYHKISTEIYEVTKGVLTLFVDGKKFVLKQGEKMTITPGQVHNAQGEDVWFLTYSSPGWSAEDAFVI